MEINNYKAIVNLLAKLYSYTVLASYISVLTIDRDNSMTFPLILNALPANLSSQI